MARPPLYKQFKSSKNVDYFLELCEKSSSISIKWKKFKELDSKHLFDNLEPSQLHMFYRKIRFNRLGVCWQCGTNPIYKASYCKECYDKIKTKSLKNQKQRYIDAKRNRG